MTLEESTSIQWVKLMFFFFSHSSVGYRFNRNFDAFFHFLAIISVIVLKQTNTFPWIPQIPPKIHGLSAALNGRINSQISLEIFD